MHRSLAASLAALLFFAGSAVGQSQEQQPENAGQPLKILHAEPLYIDLIRDLGARKGEKEWNVGGALVDSDEIDKYEFLIEYEWAVKDRWGLELEVPATIYTTNKRNGREPTRPVEKPSNRIESLKMATQYTFLVSEKARASFALGSIVEWELKSFDEIQLSRPLEGVLFNPFLVAAKRLGSNWHSLVYTGPRFRRHFGHSEIDMAYEINTSVHYMIPFSRNFVGVEVNKMFDEKAFSMVVRPQMRLVINEGLMVGIVPGIPINIEGERLSAFMRLIYEPGHRR